jgi:hypothetical protein
VVCTKHRERRESIYWCSEFEAGMCLDGCFKTLTNLNFQLRCFHCSYTACYKINL